MGRVDEHGHGRQHRLTSDQREQGSALRRAAGRKPRHGFRARPPRLDIPCKASVRLGKTYYTVDVHDISLGGIKVEPIEEYCVGKKVVVAVESLRPVKGEVRWYSERRAGIVFERPLEFEELTEWVGKRLELASLKASYKVG